MTLWYGMVVFFILARLVANIWPSDGDTAQKLRFLTMALDAAWFACLAALVYPGR